MFLFLQKTLAYVAYDMDESRTTVIEFEYTYGKTDYPKGTGYAQVYRSLNGQVSFEENTLGSGESPKSLFTK